MQLRKHSYMYFTIFLMKSEDEMEVDEVGVDEMKLDEIGGIRSGNKPFYTCTCI